MRENKHNFFLTGRNFLVAARMDISGNRPWNPPYLGTPPPSYLGMGKVATLENRAEGANFFETLKHRPSYFDQN